MFSDLIESIQRLLPAVGSNLLLSAVTIAVSLPVGFLIGVVLTSRHRIIRFIAVAFVEVFRGLPTLLTLYIVYFGIAQLLLIESFTAVVIALGLTSAAYSAEIFRASIQSTPRGQLEAAAALALSKSRTLLLIVVPHVLRVAVPPIIGIAILTFHGTALAFTVGQKELMGTALSYGLQTFEFQPDLAVVAVIYLIVTYALAGVEMLAERRAARISGRPHARRRRRVKTPIAS